MTDDGSGTRAATKVEELRELRDPRTLRALAHPVRMDLIEALVVEGPLTATEAAAIIDYKTRHGDFRLWADMLQIYGVDGEKCEALKDKMEF